MPSMKGVQKETIQSNKGRIHFTFKGIRLGGCLFLLGILACCTGKKYSLKKEWEQVQVLVKSGDVIVRNGNDEVSNTARSFNRRDKSYSHCGLIQVERDTVFVYHALGGSYNPSQKLLRQTLADFCAEESIDRVAVYRYPLNNGERERLSSWVQARYTEGLPFDLFFNFDTDDKMYCSEFVFKGLNAAKENALSRLLPRSGEVLYVAIDDLYLNGFATRVFSADLN